MKEIEVKILEIDRKKVEKRLRSLGARKTLDGRIKALYFDCPDRSLRKAKDALRLRKVDSRTVLTFKKFVKDGFAKVREELETEVSDFDKARSILQNLGFSVWLEMEKHRTTYELNGAHFEFDKYKGKYGFIPEFLEIEAKSPSQIHKYAKLLGFKKSDCKPWTSWELIKHYER
jgi:adenylate cyclase class 2